MFLQSVGLGVFIAASIIYLIKKPDNTFLNGVYFLSALCFLILAANCFVPDFEQSNIYLILKLSPMLIVPAFIYNIPDKIKEDGLSIFLYSVTGMNVLLIFNQVYALLVSGELNTYYDFLKIIDSHPIYFSVFNNMALWLILFRRKITVFNVLIFFALVYGLFMMQSKIGILFFGIQLMIWAISLFKRYAVIGIIFLLLIFPLYFYSTSAKKLNRFSDFKNIDYEQLLGNDQENGVSQRIWLWKKGIQLFKAMPVSGYGINNVPDALSEIVEKESPAHSESYNRAARIISREFNIHNQFMQLLMEGGVLIALPFFLLFVIQFILVVKRSSFIDALPLLMFIAVLMVENYLARQSGIYTFSLFTALLGYNLKKPVM
jgi:O-antigen ligase